MKCWWIVLILLALPLIGHVEDSKNEPLKIGIQGYHDMFPSALKGWDFPAVALLTVEAQQPLKNVSVDLTFFVEDTPEFSFDQLQAARCGVMTAESAHGALRTFPPLDVGKAWELWVPALKERTMMSVIIGWDNLDLAIQAVTLNVRSDQTTQHQRWKKGELQLTKKTVKPYPWIASNPPLRAIPLDQVCEQFIPLQMPRTYLMAGEMALKPRAAPFPGSVSP
ncbi:MAG: hypothetical protein R3B74_09535 [Nitrospirales bacterium]|nr:hypothetical protein [Nitrospirales bacterium]